MSETLDLVNDMFDIEQYLTDEESTEDLDLKEKKSFKVVDDKTAEWILRKIKEEQLEQERQIKTIKLIISEYKFKKGNIENKSNKKIARLNEFLKEYFATLTTKTTKTQQTYVLPSGKLIQKINRKDYHITNDLLLTYLKNNQMYKYIKTEQIPKWGELKKIINISKDGTKVVDEDGVIIDGIKVIPKLDEFEVKMF